MNKKISQPAGSANGFTLLELMVTLAILAIILTIATASFIPQINASQTRATSDSLRASIAQARSESITRGGNVRVCGSLDGASCGNDFNNGWMIYHDSDANSIFSATDSVLTWHEQDYVRIAITSQDALGAAVSDFGFNYRGYPTTSLTLGVTAGSSNALVQLWAHGRVEIQ